MDSTQTPRNPEGDQRRALDALNVIISNSVPVVFRATLERPSREFYWVTVHYLIADISTLVANATGLPLDQGRFRASIIEILDRLKELGSPVEQYTIIEEENENPAETETKTSP